MYRDSEQSYGSFTLDTYQTEKGLWACDWWRRGQPDICGVVYAPRRKDAVARAKMEIDALVKK